MEDLGGKVLIYESKTSKSWNGQNFRREAEKASAMNNSSTAYFICNNEQLVYGHCI